MGNRQVKPPSPSQGVGVEDIAIRAPGEPNGAKGGGCPMRSTKRGKEGDAGHASAALAAAAQAKPKNGVPDRDGCPMSDQGAKAGTRPVYNVYAQAIDPTNQMPANPNQQPAPGQSVPLSTERVLSTIPKGGTVDTWLYPSAQMFWNALVRKGKAEGASEQDMEVVVAIHNNMNENTWRAVLQWEDLHRDSGSKGPTPRLSRFIGRPHDLSPKAWLKTLFGHPHPFDRHDWVVERDTGKEVRYVIDYYHDDEAAKENMVPKLQDVDSVKSISIDVRPALDSIDAAIDRMVRMPFSIMTGSTAFRPLPFMRGTPRLALPASNNLPPAEDSRVDFEALSEQVHRKCGEHFVAMQTCKTDAERSKAAIGMTFCLARLLCKDEAAAFSRASESGDENALETTFASMQDCLDGFENRLSAQRKQ